MRRGQVFWEHSGSPAAEALVWGEAGCLGALREPSRAVGVSLALRRAGSVVGLAGESVFTL